jgi:hypothetical protein
MVEAEKQSRTVVAVVWQAPVCANEETQTQKPATNLGHGDPRPARHHLRNLVRAYHVGNELEVVRRRWNSGRACGDSFCPRCSATRWRGQRQHRATTCSLQLQLGEALLGLGDVSVLQPGCLLEV